MAGKERIDHDHDDTDDTEDTQRTSEKGGDAQRIRYNPSRTQDDDR